MADLAIIGGGLTGLTAAYRLRNKGHDVTIYEASDTIGGLAAGFASSPSHEQMTGLVSFLAVFIEGGD